MQSASISSSHSSSAMLTHPKPLLQSCNSPQLLADSAMSSGGVVVSPQGPQSCQSLGAKSLPAAVLQQALRAVSPRASAPVGLAGRPAPVPVAAPLPMPMPVPTLYGSFTRPGEMSRVGQASSHAASTNASSRGYPVLDFSLLSPGSCDSFYAGAGDSLGRRSVADRPMAFAHGGAMLNEHQE